MGVAVSVAVSVAVDVVTFSLFNVWQGLNYTLEPVKIVQELSHACKKKQQVSHMTSMLLILVIKHIFFLCSPS